MGPIIDLDDLGFDRGAHVLVERALARLAPGTALTVRGRDPHLGVHLPAWARAHGHSVTSNGEELALIRGTADEDRWRGAQRAGGPGPSGIVERAPATWGLAARGALVEDGGPPLHHADLDRRDEVWADIAPKLYAQALAGQWDPATAVDWAAPLHPDPAVEATVVQVMTYLIENEQAALVVPARFIARVHPHFREVVQLLAVQAADEARHVEVFTRRAELSGGPLGTSGAGGRASLQTLLDEADFSLAAFLLSVLGEGTFLDLLGFLERHGPDPVTRRVAHLALADE
ncbi:MAG: ferritin-like domain-containing protein, partial [Actinobacteria bacterium]|nr:ferritin-like domain-containing protein [Actinomycetota bacterium]